ncbi:hypothetical protein EDD17DRAFT_685688 [Pisolithus thermaeus]|nr:hypothetical protein EV401DRAFT_1844758 [Pisolithus croceorrhizus]KAI6161450.1 hypothetical protein EDD17DRAFT_685688 [Pisolithus thermaeus]
MDGWVDYLHFSFFGEHVLFHSLRVDSFWTFFLSSVLVAVICLVERFLTAFSSKKFRPRWASRSQVACASWDASLYGLVTLFRVLYMLVIMSYQAGIIAVAVISLSVGQFLVEYHLNHARAADSDRLVNEPLLGNPVEHLGVRAKSKPAAIFIHPYESNLARADAAALELGIAGDTELVAGNRLPDDGAWENGKGSIVARELFGKNSQS